MELVMKFMRRTAGYSLLGHRRNENILEELKVEPSNSMYQSSS
jgi:hypothetical protein